MLASLLGSKPGQYSGRSGVQYSTCLRMHAVCVRDACLRCFGVGLEAFATVQYSKFSGGLVLHTVQ